MPTIEAFLREMVERGGSDLHVTQGSPPAIRLHGELSHLAHPPLSPTDTRNLCYSHPFTGAVVTETVMADVKVNPELLKRIAERTGAEFFRAEDPAAQRQVFERIDRLEKSEIKMAAYRRYRELFPSVLALAAALLAAAGLLWASGLRVVPA